MVIGTLPKPGEQLRDGQVTEIWVRAGPAMIGCAVMIAVLAFIHRAFSGLVAPILLNGWVGAMAGVVGVTLGLILAFSAPRLRARLPGRFWVGATRMIGIAFNAGAAVGVWILMPPADDALRMLIVFLLVWFVAMVMMANGDQFATVGSLGVIASLMLFVATHKTPYSFALIGFLAMAGAAIAIIRVQIWRAADQAADARALSELAAEQLRLALALVSAERDAKTRFIAAATHDLQQPLQAAALYFDQLLDGPDAATHDRAVSGVQRALGSTQALLSTMLDFLRLEAGAMPVRREMVALGAVIAELAMEHDAAARMAGMQIIAARSQFTTSADAHLLRRALGNLVANAVRHSGGRRVTIGARRRGDGVRLWVIDDGRGIQAADLPTLFEDFTQGTVDRDAACGGFGIGLASARRMVSLMGGTIGVEQRRRGGCAFHIDLPVSAAEVTVEAAKC
ncbi:HAMP domain-containing sensor histidine kinase [Sphingomonas sp. AR_OL41]|uniref:sensor histidine kinase n=1 Tax=Sphingomonas sp. AR_OL41 TaxID=3042729 RepID=UPI00248166E5|nr:HAMP domain-containing sensor histidine kinase [Sphingomonas sp. AR_OL41]MDH7972868.1 HAMP domain-containing sensor histidine kinase [Sphingomonas sp. AR_OL41]